MKKIFIIFAAVAVFLLGRATLSQTALTSMKLPEVIYDTSSQIDLLSASNAQTTITAQMLEAFRSDNNGALSFAVKVNEIPTGWGAYSSGGIAIESVSLVVKYDTGITKSYSKFSTETQALIAPADSINRQIYYTLLGDVKTGNIETPRRISGVDYDSTFKITVPDNLSTVTSAVLNINLLTPNVSSGPVEQFYKYSTMSTLDLSRKRYTPIAIVTSAVSKYLDQSFPLSSGSMFRRLVPAMQLSPEGVANQNEILADIIPGSALSASNIIEASTPLSWVWRPGAEAYNIVTYEDRYPNKSDYDFNDVVVAYRYKFGINSQGMIERVDGVAYLVARGGNYTHNWILDIPLPSGVVTSGEFCVTKNSDAVQVITKVLTPVCKITTSGGKLHWEAFSGTRDLLPPDPLSSSPQRNTLPGGVKMQGAKATFVVTFKSPIAFSDWGADDPMLYVIDTKRMINLSTKDSSGFPFALHVPSAWQMPQEAVDMGMAYTSFSNFIKTSGEQSKDWYLHPNTSKTMSWTAASWAW